jgi:AAA+ ATPase superfamily predicted ATPase
MAIEKNDDLKTSFFGRSEELGLLEGYLQQKGSGLVFLRGRRRIGKSWLLKRFASEADHCFYFQGDADSSR